MKKILGLVLIILMVTGGIFIFAGCGVGVRQPNEDKEMEIVSIHFVLIKFLGGSQYHRFYDFTEMTFSTKNTNEWVEEQEEDYAVIATFTEEQAEAFFERMKEIGILDLLEEYYPDTEGTFDGAGWDLEITFSDGTVFKSRGANNFSVQIDALDKAVLSLTGYKLF